jgi:hypothetical protein
MLSDNFVNAAEAGEDMILRWMLHDIHLTDDQMDEAIRLAHEVDFFPRVTAEFQRVMCLHFGLPFFQGGRL